MELVLNCELLDERTFLKPRDQLTVVSCWFGICRPLHLSGTALNTRCQPIALVGYALVMTKKPSLSWSLPDFFFPFLLWSHPSITHLLVECLRPNSLFDLCNYGTRGFLSACGWETRGRSRWVRVAIDPPCPERLPAGEPEVWGAEDTSSASVVTFRRLSLSWSEFPFADFIPRWCACGGHFCSQRHHLPSKAPRAFWNWI